MLNKKNEPKDCLHYQVCKFADDGCLDGCEFRIEKPTSTTSDYMSALYEVIDKYLYDAGAKQPTIDRCFAEIQSLNASHFA